MYVRGLGEGSAFVAAIQHEFEEKNRWRVELARITGRPVPTSRMSLDDFAREVSVN